MSGCPRCPLSSITTRPGPGAISCSPSNPRQRTASIPFYLCRTAGVIFWPEAFCSFLLYSPLRPSGKRQSSTLPSFPMVSLWYANLFFFFFFLTVHKPLMYSVHTVYYVELNQFQFCFSACSSTYKIWCRDICNVLIWVESLQLGFVCAGSLWSPRPSSRSSFATGRQAERSRFDNLPTFPVFFNFPSILQFSFSLWMAESRIIIHRYRYLWAKLG